MSLEEGLGWRSGYVCFCSRLQFTNWLTTSSAWCIPTTYHDGNPMHTFPSTGLSFVLGMNSYGSLEVTSRSGAFYFTDVSTKPSHYFPAHPNTPRVPESRSETVYGSSGDLSHESRANDLRPNFCCQDGTSKHLNDRYYYHRVA